MNGSRPRTGMCLSYHGCSLESQASLLTQDPSCFKLRWSKICDIFLEIKDTNNLFFLSNLSDTTEDTKSAPFSGDSERDRGFTDTTVFISLGLFVALLTTVMAIIVYLKLRSRRPILRRLPRYK